MARKILFRGFTQSNFFDGEKWVYGDLVHDSFNGDFNVAVGIRSAGCYPVGVNPDSVGQFTGLTDKNGVKIFEGDKLNVGYNHIGVVVVAFERGAFNVARYDLKNCEVIGNVFENNELVAGKKLEV